MRQIKVTILIVILLLTIAACDSTVEGNQFNSDKCEPGTTDCNDDLLLHCSPYGNWEFLVDCADMDAICEDGICHKFESDGDEELEIEDELEGAELGEDAEGEREFGEDWVRECTPGGWNCKGNWRRYCNPPGYYVLVEDCEEMGLVCHMGGCKDLEY